MTRRFPRNTLEDAFQELELLEKQIDELTNNKEHSLPFRDKDNFPPGIEGQLVLATYIPPVVFGELIFIAWPSHSADFASIYSSSTVSDEVVELYPSSDLFQLHVMSWSRDYTRIYWDGLATGVTAAYDTLHPTWGLWNKGSGSTDFSRVITLTGEDDATNAEFHSPAFTTWVAQNRFIETPGGLLKVIRVHWDAREVHTTGDDSPTSLYVYDHDSGTTTQIASPSDFPSEYRYGGLDIGMISQNASKVAIIKGNMPNDVGHSSNPKVYSVEIDGSGVTLLDMPAPSYFLYPMWNPSNNGELIFTGSDGIHLTYADGSSEAGCIWTLPSGDNMDDIAFSSDGTKMAFMSGGMFDPGEDATLKIVTADGTSTTDTGVTAMLGETKLAWNPAGTQIALVYNNSSNETAIKIYDIAADTATIVHASVTSGIADMRQAMWNWSNNY